MSDSYLLLANKGRIIWAGIAAFGLAIPLMKLRKHVIEPYYLIIFLILGFIGGVASVNITFQKLNLSSWLIFIYGSLGVICALTAWFYLNKNINKWYEIT